MKFTLVDPEAADSIVIKYDESNPRLKKAIEQWNRLDFRLGKGVGAKKERRRLRKNIMQELES